MQVDRYFIGADVGKFEIVIASHHCAQSKPLTIPNTRSAIRGWLRTISPATCLAMEATGGYQNLLADMAHAHGLSVYVLNARWVHHYAMSLGNRGKTDRLDAQVIARYLAQEHEALHPYAPEPAQLKRLREQQALRAAVVKAATLLKLSLARLAQADEQGLVRDAVVQLHQVDKQLTQQMQRQVKATPQTAHTYRLLRTVTGIGAHTAISLSTLLARIRFANADAIVAYSGLDPRPKESGNYTGQRKVSKQGDKRLRALLYNGACSACQTKAFSSYYRGLRERGLATTEALVILARKLLRIAYGVWRTQRPFDPGLLKPGLT